MEQIKQNHNKYKQIKEENLFLQSAFKVKMTLFYIARTRSMGLTCTPMGMLC